MSTQTFARQVLRVVAQCLSRGRRAAVSISLATLATASATGDTIAGDKSPTMVFKISSITIPDGCVVDPSSPVSTTKSCHLAADAAGSSLKVQLDEAVVPLDQYMDPPWTQETIVAAMTRPFFSNWVKGSTKRTPINTITSAPVPEKDLPPGMTACRSYSFDRSDPGVQMHMREFGLFCIRLHEPVQHPLLLVGSVRLTMYGGRLETYPSEFDAMSEAILASYRLVAP